MKKTILLFLFICTLSVAQNSNNEEEKTRKELRKERKEAKKKKNKKNKKYATNFPKGIYYSLEELVSLEPKKTSKLVVQKRSSASMKRQGGNEYKLYDSNFIYSKSDVKKKFYAYSDGKFLYMNALKHKLQHSYFKVLGDGKYLVFKSGIPTNASKKSVQMQIASAKAPAGKRLSGPILATLRFVYILNKETGKVTVVDKRNIAELMADAPQLVEAYNQEAQRTSNKTLLKYILKYNVLEESEKTAPTEVEDEL